MKNTHNAKNVILVNIWDDYHDDGFVPEGERQDTYLYIDNWADEIAPIRAIVLMSVLEYLSKNYPQFNPHLVCKWYRDGSNTFKIKLENITHVHREKLVKTLNKQKMKFSDIPYEFISES